MLQGLATGSRVPKEIQVAVVAKPECYVRTTSICTGNVTSV